MICHPGGCGNTGVRETALPSEQTAPDPEELENTLFIPRRLSPSRHGFQGPAGTTFLKSVSGTSVSLRETEKLFRLFLSQYPTFDFQVPLSQLSSKLP